jgi:hypothetical protein
MNRVRTLGVHVFVVASVMTTSFACKSAEVLINMSGSGSVIVEVVGPIVGGDSLAFKNKIDDLERALVVLRSPGGSLREGLAIGALIRQKGFVTAVAEDTFCASACALAWLGGRTRLMRETSKIGFHAAYVKGGSYKRESGVGNALVGAYLRDMGLSLEVIEYVTSAGPDEIQWLSFRDAIRLGIGAHSYETTLLGSQAEGPLLKSKPGGYETSARAVRNFYPRFKKLGMAGMSESVAACYKRAAELRTLTSVQYCFSIDLLAVDLSIWGEKKFKFPILPYFTAAQANNRAREILLSLAVKEDIPTMLSEWNDLTLLANISMNQPQQ